MIYTEMPMFGKKMWEDHAFKSLLGNVKNSLSQKNRIKDNTFIGLYTDYTKALSKVFVYFFSCNMKTAEKIIPSNK